MSENIELSSRGAEQKETLKSGLSQVAETNEQRQKINRAQRKAAKRIVRQEWKIAKLQQQLAATKIAQQRQKITKLQKKLAATQIARQRQMPVIPPVAPNAPAPAAGSASELTAVPVTPELTAAPGDSSVTAQLSPQSAEPFSQLDQLMNQQREIIEVLQKMNQPLAQQTPPELALQTPPGTVSEPPNEVTVGEPDGDLVAKDVRLSGAEEGDEDSEEVLEQEDFIDILAGIGTGAMAGSATGASAGPYGALAGALLGGLFGVAQTVEQQRRKRAASSGKYKTPVSSAKPTGPAPIAASPAEPIASSGFSEIISPQVIQQLATLLPQLTPALSARPSAPALAAASPAGPMAASGGAENVMQVVQQVAELLPRVINLIAQRPPAAASGKPAAESMDGDEVSTLMLEEDEEYSDAAIDEDYDESLEAAFDEDPDDGEDLLEWLSDSGATDDELDEWLDEESAFAWAEGN